VGYSALHQMNLFLMTASSGSLITVAATANNQGDDSEKEHYASISMNVMTCKSNNKHNFGESDMSDVESVQ